MKKSAKSLLNTTSTWFKKVLVCTTTSMLEGPLHVNPLLYTGHRWTTGNIDF